MNPWLPVIPITAGTDPLCTARHRAERSRCATANGTGQLSHAGGAHTTPPSDASTATVTTTTGFGCVTATPPKPAAVRIDPSPATPDRGGPRQRNHASRTPATHTVAAGALPVIDVLTAARAEALFASDLSAADQLTRAEASAAIRRAMRRYGGSRGCAGAVAGAYGEHPETAVPRMRWALGVVHAVYPPHPARHRTAWPADRGVTTVRNKEEQAP